VCVEFVKGEKKEKKSSYCLVLRRNLVKWDGGEGKDVHLEETDTKDWDQFEVNAKKFGYKSTFDMDLYTTPLDKNSAFFKENEGRAAKLAAEIEGKSASTSHQAEERGQDDLFDQADEEDRYSGVHSAAAGSKSGNVYVPPHLRKMEPAVIPPPASAAPQIPALASPAPVLPTPASPLSATKDRKKLTLNPGITAFKPGFNISFSPAPVPSAPSPVAAPAIPASPSVAAPLAGASFPSSPAVAASPARAVAPAVPSSEVASSPSSSLSAKERMRLTMQKGGDSRSVAPTFVPQQPTVPTTFAMPPHYVPLQHMQQQQQQQQQQHQQQQMFQQMQMQQQIQMQQLQQQMHHVPYGPGPGIGGVGVVLPPRLPHK
jgi:hypothetical protein